MYVIMKINNTGLFDNKRRSHEDGQPRLAELAMIYLDADLAVQEEKHAYVYPDGWEMPWQATRINGVTEDHLRQMGEPIEVVLGLFLNAVATDQIVVGHGIPFDLKQMRGELRRIDAEYNRNALRWICTMNALTGRGIPKLNGKTGAPRLEDACAFFGIERVSERPNALAIAHDVRQVFIKMRERGLVPEPRISDHD